MHKRIDCAGVVKVTGCGHTYFGSLRPQPHYRNERERGYLTSVGPKDRPLAQ